MKRLLLSWLPSHLWFGNDGTLVQPDYTFIMQPLPERSLEREVVVDVKDCFFPGLIIVVIRELLVAFGDEAIGTHLHKIRGEIGPKLLLSLRLTLVGCVYGGGGKEGG